MDLTARIFLYESGVVPKWLLKTVQNLLREEKPDTSAISSIELLV